MATQIIPALDAQYKKVPYQKQNLDAMKAFITNGKRLPDSKKTILYAIDGKAGLADILEYAEIIKKTGATLIPKVHVNKKKPLVYYFVSNGLGPYHIRS